MREDLENNSSEEMAATRSAELYGHLVEYSPDAICVLRGNKFHYVNAAGAKLFSASNLAELAAKSLTDFAHRDHKQTIEKLLDEIGAGGKRAERFEAKLYRLDGSLIDVEISFSLMTLPDGTAVQAVIRDIGEQKRDAESIRASEEYYRDLVEHSRDLMCTHDLEGRILSVNEAAVRLSGYEASHFLNKSIRDFLAPEFKSLFDDYLLRVKSDGYAEGLMQVQTCSGERHIWRYYNTLRMDGIGPPVVRGMAHDITDLKRAQEKILKLNAELEQRAAEAEAASRAKDNFLATVSHELRAPLTSMLIWSHVLRNSTPDPATLTRGLEAIERNTRVQAKLIEDILDMSRIVSGKLHLNTRRTDLLPVIAAAIDVVRPAANAKGIDLKLNACDPAREVQGDPDRLQQVVWNLLSNAVKFTDSGGSVEVKLEHAGAYAQISVTDTGLGISPKFLPYVFDRFRQAEDLLTRKHGGLGLGLAIVRHLVELHGGTVEVESAGESHGACFRLRLPLIQECAIGKLQESEVSHSISDSEFDTLDRVFSLVEGLRVMVVDDDPDTIEAVLIALEQHGAKVMTCSSAADAIKILQQYRPDILVSDIAMPDEDGYSLIRKVRALSADEGGGVPAVAMTAHVRPEDRLTVLSAGYQAFVPKPVEVNEFLTSLATLARGPESHSI